MGRKFTWTLIALLMAAGPVVAAASLKADHVRTSQSEQQKTARPDDPDCAHFLPYGPEAEHIWNRVYRQLWERRDANGKTWGCNEVDPLLWDRSRHILVNPAYKETVRLLDEFTSTHSERLVHDALQRALFQRDLWAIFNWLARRGDDYQREREELERRLATIINSISLTDSEIRALPDNYAQMVGPASGDLELPNRTPGWLLIGREDAEPVAAVHSSSFPASVFLVYLRLPSGRSSYSEYLESLREYSRLRPKEDDCQFRACSPPQFPAGTEVGLVRRAVLIDASGQPVLSPITESVQIRRYIKIPSGIRVDFVGDTQEVAEYRLSRGNGAISLQPIGPNEVRFRVFSTHGIDAFEDFRNPVAAASVALRTCHSCHQGVGVTSFTSYSRVQFEREHLFVLIDKSTEARETTAAIKYLQGRDAWKLLKGMSQVK